MAPPVASSTCVGWVRPRVVTITPLGMKMLAISCASSTRPPPLPRRSNTSPRAPACSSCSTASRTSACEPGLKLASATTPSLTPWTVLVADSTTGSETTARVILTLCAARGGSCRRAALRCRAGRCVPGRPLDQRGGRFGRQAFELAPVDRDDHVARLQPRARRGRGVEDARDQQPAVGGARWRRTRRCR